MEIAIVFFVLHLRLLTRAASLILAILNLRGGLLAFALARRLPRRTHTRTAGFAIRGTRTIRGAHAIGRCCSRSTELRRALLAKLLEVLAARRQQQAKAMVKVVDLPSRLCGEAVTHEGGDLFPFRKLSAREVDDDEQELAVSCVGPRSGHGVVSLWSNVLAFEGVLSQGS